MSNIQRLKADLDSEAVKSKFNEILGKKAPGFISSIISAVSTNPKLAECEPGSVVSSAAVAATLDLPINQSLGFAYIVPYGNKAQFQIGYKGLIQLAMRTGEYKTINTTEVYDGQLQDHNQLTGFFSLNGEKQSDDIVGYAAYFSLVNGFEKMMYMSMDGVEKHGKRYSKSFASANGLWKNDFDVMAKKTVLKQLLSKYGYLSIEMQRAVETDQGVIVDDNVIEYPDAKEQMSFDVEEAVEASGQLDLGGEQ